MSRNFVISPQVRRVIGEKVFRRLLTSDDYAVVRCAVCRENILSDSGKRISVSVDTDGKTMRLWVAHSKCSPSRVIPRRGLKEALEEQMPDTMAVFFTRDMLPHAVLAFETVLQVMAGESMASVRDQTIPVFLAQGFTRITTDIADFQPQPAKGWSLELPKRKFIVRAPNKLEAYIVGTSEIPSAWLELVRKERACLVLTGPVLGLPAADEQQFLEGAPEGDRC